MRISRKGAERDRGTKRADIIRSDLEIRQFDDRNIITFKFTPSSGFDPDCTHDYSIDLRVDEFVHLIDKLNRSAWLRADSEISRQEIENLIGSFSALVATLKG